MVAPLLSGGTNVITIFGYVSRELTDPIYAGTLTGENVTKSENRPSP